MDVFYRIIPFGKIRQPKPFTFLLITKSYKIPERSKEGFPLLVNTGVLTRATMRRSLALHPITVLALKSVLLFLLHHSTTDWKNSDKILDWILPIIYPLCNFFLVTAVSEKVIIKSIVITKSQVSEKSWYFPLYGSENFSWIRAILWVGSNLVLV